MKLNILHNGLSFLLLFALTNVAIAHDWRNPNSPFDAKTKMDDTIQVTWITANDVNIACEAESIRRGNGGFKGVKVQACSFWLKTASGYQCTMITAKNPTIHNLGHEIRHCFQGDYH